MLLILVLLILILVVLLILVFVLIVLLILVLIFLHKKSPRFQTYYRQKTGRLYYIPNNTFALFLVIFKTSSIGTFLISEIFSATLIIMPEWQTFPR